MSKLIDIPDKYRPEIEELPGELARIAAAIEAELPGRGVEIVLILAQIFPGQPLYIRDLSYLARRMRDDAIRAEYDAGGCTMLELATRWRLSHIRIKQILAETGEKKNDDRQLRMW